MKTQREGYVLAEIVAAAALITALLGLSLQLAHATNTARRVVERRAIAQQEAANVLERLSQYDVDQLTPERLADVRLGADVLKLLPDAALALSVVAAENRPPGKQLRVEITWSGADGQPEAPVRLSHWKFAAPLSTETRP